MVYINVFLAIMSLSGYMFFFYRKQYASAFSLPLLTVSSIISIIYIFGIIGHLTLGYYFSLFAGISLLLYSMNKGQSLRIQINKKNWFAIIICIVPFLIYFWSVSSDFMFTQWDEFSFWAISLKFIYPFNSLYTADSTIIFKNYPPAQQILQYFVLKTLGWKESTILITQIFFLLACMLSTAGQLIKNKNAASIVFLASITLFYFFDYNLSTIYVDPLLAVYFSTTLAWCISCKGNRSELIICALLLFILVIIKQVGLILACICIMAYFTARLRLSDMKFLIRKNILHPLFLIATVSVSYASWYLYTRSIGASVHITPPSLKDFLTLPLLERLGVTFINFGERITNPQYFKFSQNDAGLSLVMMVGLIVILFIMSFILNKKESSKSLPMTCLSLIVGFFIYNLFLLYCYLVVFTDYEGRALASFYRYSATYSLAILFVAICITIDSMNGIHKLASTIAAFITLGIALGCVPAGFYHEIKHIQGSDGGIEVRVKVKNLAEKIKKDANGKDVSSYFISQQSTGFEKYVFNYEMMPYKSQWWCWSIGKVYNADDVWTCDKSLLELTKEYDYIAIYNGDKQFWDLANKYLAPGSIESSFGVYRIERKNNNLSLIKVN